MLKQKIRHPGYLPGALVAFSLLSLAALPSAARADLVTYGLGFHEEMNSAADLAGIPASARFSRSTRYFLHTGYEMEGRKSSFEINLNLEGQYYSYVSDLMRFLGVTDPFVHYDLSLPLEATVGFNFFENEYWKVYLKIGMTGSFILYQNDSIGSLKTETTIFHPAGRSFSELFDLYTLAKPGALFFVNSEMFLYVNVPVRYNIALSPLELLLQTTPWRLGIDVGFGYRLD